MTIKWPDMEKIFRNIYLNRGWFNGSGSGSLPENTEIYRHFLQDFMQKHDIKTVLDLGCGDWQSTKLMDWDGISYLGLDVVPQVIEDVQRQYGKENIQFACADIISSALPQADLVIIKDVLQHWPNAAIEAFLSQLAPYKYVLITNTIAIQSTGKGKEAQLMPQKINHDIELGAGRPVDLRLPPFNVPCDEVLRYPSTKRYQPIQDIKSVMLLKK